MKKLLLILIALPIIGFGQQKTYVPDDNFEQALINLGYDNVLDDSVLTSNINTVTDLYVQTLGISDLTGLEDFTSLIYLSCWGNQLTSLDVSSLGNLTHLNCGDIFGGNMIDSLDVRYNPLLIVLYCSNNQLTSLDVSNNTFLTEFECSSNQITSLDVSYNTDLISLYCYDNQINVLNVNNNTSLYELACGNNLLTSLDVSYNTLLYWLYCETNQITSLDVSDNTDLEGLWCSDNKLTSLDVRTGNNSNMLWDVNLGGFQCSNNPELYCIDVDDVAWSDTNWLVSNGDIDVQHYFSANCSTTEIQEHTTNKELLKVTDLLGREIKGTKNEVLFYIYDDGTVEKRIVIE
jgi:Leucine-rich repeat (LRR) protein